MKICLVIPTLKQGGAERVISELANEWAAKGYEVHLILLASATVFYRPSDAVNVHELGFRNSGKIGKLISELKTFIKLRSLMKSLNPVFVLSFMEKYNAFTILASAFLGLKVFVSDRSNPLAPVPRSVNFLRRQTYKYAAGIIAQTTLAKDVLSKSTGNTNIRVIPNPVKNIVAESSVEKRNIVLNVGRLVPEKGQKYLIDVFAGVDSSSDWTLVILGEGPLREELQNQAQSLGIEDRVLFKGAVNDVDKWLESASIFVFPSISEGYPNALIEAMSAGLPCVSFDCNAGPSEIIVDGENGFLVEVGNRKLLQQQMSLLMVDPQLREKIGRQAKKITERLNMQTVAQLFLDFCSGK